jgi:ATPase subunit of ABC transporter with duplicated ATPase domains
MIILDEPSNHLPTAVLIRVIERLRRWPEPPAVLLISHDPNLLAIADDRHALLGFESKEHAA